MIAHSLNKIETFGIIPEHTYGILRLFECEDCCDHTNEHVSLIEVRDPYKTNHSKGKWNNPEKRNQYKVAEGSILLSLEEF